MIHSLLAALCLMGLGALLWNIRGKIPPFLFLSTVGAGDDADMKIVSGSFSEPRKAEDASEQAAREFLRHKQSGNIDRARELGKEYAHYLIQVDSGPLAGEIEGKDLFFQHHQYLLYTFVVNRVIAEGSPNSILAQTSLNVFFSEVENASEELYRHIGDTAAFSLYILCERTPGRSDDELGMIFADLLNASSDPAMIDYGNYLYRKLYRFCREKIQNVPYIDVENGVRE